MNFYERTILPPILNLVMQNRELLPLRRKMVPEARGDVLEVGIGSGLNLPFYGSAVRSVTGIDPSEGLQRLAMDRVATVNFPVTFVAESSEAMPFENAAFDTVLTTWTLCSIPDPMAALSEMRRVLKPEGRLLFIEHGRAPDASVARWQNRVNGAWRTIAGGCNLNREMDGLVREAGFTIESLETGYLRGPRILTFNYQGAAHPA